MNLQMSPAELDLFFSFLRKSERYVEFGAGGSTVAAASHVKSWIVSVDSSLEWLADVKTACAESMTQPELYHADIGPLRDWGNPADDSARDRWPNYHSALWLMPKSLTADLYFVDGRFRVACFAQIVLHCNPDALIGFHDFTSRGQYHIVREIAREIAVAEDMSFFQPLPGKKEKAIEILEAFKFEFA